jgi:hypothetical protein
LNTVRSKHENEAVTMKYEVGDTVSFDVPIAAQLNQSTKRRQQRFQLGKISARLDEQEAYRIVALSGQVYYVLEDDIGGKAGIVQQWEVAA